MPSKKQLGQKHLAADYKKLLSKEGLVVLHSGNKSETVYRLKKGQKIRNGSGHVSRCRILMTKKSDESEFSIRKVSRQKIRNVQAYRYALAYKLQEENKVLSFGKTGTYTGHLCGNENCVYHKHVKQQTRKQGEEDKSFHTFLLHDDIDVRKQFEKIHKKLRPDLFGKLLDEEE